MAGFTARMVTEVPRVGRKLRKPSHSFQLRTRPFQIQPFLLAPVLPGETLKNALLQSRVVTDPVKSPFIGWWQEYYLFYVKHRDLDERDILTEMMLNPTANANALKSVPASVEKYHAANTIDWVGPCLKRVTEEYFRTEGEAWDTWKIGNLPAAKINHQGWTDSAVNSADLPNPTEIEDVPGLPPEQDKMRAMWELLTEQQLVGMTYEEWLATYGIRSPKVELHKPELIRYVRDWSYPSNTINPADGKPTSAVSWSIAERADKDRLFKEPGFVFGVTVSRPKIYLSSQKSAAASFLDNAFTWLPALMRDEVYTSLKEFAASTGPLPGSTGNYVVDVRDLFLYGDQFINFALTETNAGLVALPTPTMQKKYPSAADVDGLFVTAAPANQIRQDGICTLSILGTQTDQTL